MNKGSKSRVKPAISLQVTVCWWPTSSSLFLGLLGGFPPPPIVDNRRKKRKQQARWLIHDTYSIYGMSTSVLKLKDITKLNVTLETAVEGGQNNFHSLSLTELSDPIQTCNRSSLLKRFPYMADRTSTNYKILKYPPLWSLTSGKRRSRQ